MPTQMVGVGGAKPTQEVGRDFNLQMTNNILRVAQEVSQENIAKTKAKQIIEGKARVAQGESLASIQESQGVFDQIFGTGTIQGAKAQTIVQATDQHVLHMTTSMGQYKGQTTEEYIKSQQDYVAENLITGDPEVDNFITLASAEAIADSTAMHAKAHAMHVQEQNKVAFETTLMGASKRVNAVMKDPSIAIEDKVVALNAFKDRMARLPGQTQAAHMTSLADVMISEIKADRPEMYQGLLQGGFQVGDMFIETGQPMQFDPKTSTKIEEAFTAHQGRSNVADKMRRSSGFASLKQNALNTTVTDEELSDMVQMYLGEHGADALTMTQISTLFTQRGAAKLKETTKQEGVLSIANGSSRSNTDRTKVANDMNLYEEIALQQVQNLPPDQQEVGMQNASADVLQKVIENDVVPTGWSARWNNGFASLVDKDGKANPAFMNTLQHFNSKYPVKPELFQTGIDALPLAKVLGVKNLMQTEGVTVNEALVQYHSNLLTPKEAQEVANSKDFRDKVQKFVNDPSQKSWYQFDDLDDLKNLAQVRSSFKQHLLDNVARTGDIGDGAWEGAIVAWRRTHERVGDYAVPNYGLSLNKQAGMISPDNTFDDALTHYIFNHGQEKFGEGFNPKHVQLNMQPGYIMITPVNKDGTYIPGLEGSGRKVPLKAIGKIYNTEVTGELIKDYAGNRVLSGSEFAASLQNRMKQNKNAIELAKGGKMNGSMNDAKIYETLQHKTKGPKLQSLLESIPAQAQIGNTKGILTTIQSISKLTGFVPEDEDIAQ